MSAPGWRPSLFRKSEPHENSVARRQWSPDKILARLAVLIARPCGEMIATANKMRDNERQ
jgi:hypothetical protein